MNICFFFFGLTLVILFSGIHSATLTVNNNCPYTIWPATQTGGDGASQLSNTGFELASKESVTIDTPAPWNSGRLWARTQCSSDFSGRFTCATADCGSGQVACNGAVVAPPASLAEFTLASTGGQDTHDVSLVDGFNLPISITPQGGSGEKCTATSCGVNINTDFLSDLAVRGSDGNIIGCKSACAAFHEPQYCCTGQYGSPSTCDATSYSTFFKNKCPQAYSYPFDDTSSTFSCTGGTNYLITFCPNSTIVPMEINSFKCTIYMQI